jgi:predicted nucleotidyltransferase
MARPGAGRNCISRHRESPRARSRRRGCVIRAIVYGTFAPLSKLPSSKPTGNIPCRIFRAASRRNAGRIIEVPRAGSRARKHTSDSGTDVAVVVVVDAELNKVLPSPNELTARVARVYGFRVAATLRMLNPHSVVSRYYTYARRLSSVARHGSPLIIAVRTSARARALRSIDTLRVGPAMLDTEIHGVGFPSAMHIALCRA